MLDHVLGGIQRPPVAQEDMVISICQAVVTYLPLLWFVRGTDGMPDPAQRDMLIREEASMQTGGRVMLTAAEQKLDAYLHRLKEQEMSAAQFPPAMHFFKAKPLIQKSSIFKLLQKMPKGDVTAVDGLPARHAQTQGPQPNLIRTFFFPSLQLHSIHSVILIVNQFKSV